MDRYWILTTNFIPHRLTIKEAGKTYNMNLKKITDKQMQVIEAYGLHFFRSCDSAELLLKDLFMTLGLFIGGLGRNKFIPFFGPKPTKF